MIGRLLSLIIFRVTLITLVLGYQLLALIFEFSLLPFENVLWVMFGLSLFNGCYLWYLKLAPGLVDNPMNFVFFQFTIDIFAVSTLVLVTDGPASNFKFAYLIMILLSALFLEKISIYALTVLSLGLYFLSINLSQFFNWSEYELSSWYFSQRIASATAAQFVLCFLTALLSGFMQSTYRSGRQDLKEKEQHIRSLQEIRRKIVETLPSGLVICTDGGEINFINRVGRKLLQLEDVTNLNAWDIFKVKPEAFTLKSDSRFLLRTESEVLVGGIKKIMGISYAAMEMETGRPGNMLVFQDLTKVKMLEAHRALEDRMGAVGKMAAGVAHEIRNPLAAISGSIQVLKEMMPEDESARELAHIVDKESRRLNDIISQFLAYARPGPPPALKLLNLGDCIRSFVRLTKNDGEIKTLKVVLDLANQSELLIFGDEAKINQVFWNLIRNSFHASHPGGLVRIGCYLQGEDVICSIEDEGDGMTESQLRDLFTPFLSFRNRGTGLGMSIVYDIIKMHRAKINVQSTVGKGTRTEIKFAKYGE